MKYIHNRWTIQLICSIFNIFKKRVAIIKHPITLTVRQYHFYSSVKIKTTPMLYYMLYIIILYSSFLRSLQFVTRLSEHLQPLDVDWTLHCVITPYRNEIQGSRYPNDTTVHTIQLIWYLSDIQPLLDMVNFSPFNMKYGNGSQIMEYKAQDNQDVKDCTSQI